MPRRATSRHRRGMTARRKGNDFAAPICKPGCTKPPERKCPAGNIRHQHILETTGELTSVGVSRVPRTPPQPASQPTLIKNEGRAKCMLATREAEQPLAGASARLMRWTGLLPVLPHMHARRIAHHWKEALDRQGPPDSCKTGRMNSGLMWPSLQIDDSLDEDRSGPIGPDHRRTHNAAQHSTTSHHTTGPQPAAPHNIGKPTSPPRTRKRTTTLPPADSHRVVCAGVCVCVCVPQHWAVL